MRALYLSYDGLTDPLGGSQVLPYLVGLSGRGHHITIVSCEKAGADQAAWDRVRKTCRDAALEWHPLSYHKDPPILSTLWDVASMQQKAEQLSRRSRFDLVHCRSYVPALVGLRLKRKFGTRFLFDMRGFWPEEKLEGGGWNRNLLFRSVYRFFKSREREFFQEADAIVSLTTAARDQMALRPKDERPVADPVVIPCCVDFDHFHLPDSESRQRARQLLGIDPDAPVLCYLGSLGGYYMLDEMLRFFAAFRDQRPGARFLFVSREPTAMIAEAAAKAGLDRDAVVVRAADRSEVPELLAAADFGISFIHPTFSKIASSPTKLGEMLAAGLPMVVNAGVGDVDAIMADTGAGVVVDRFDREGLHDAAASLGAFRASSEKIREGAMRWFRLDQGVTTYHDIYRSLAVEAP